MGTMGTMALPSRSSNCLPEMRLTIEVAPRWRRAGWLLMWENPDTRPESDPI